MAVVIAKEHTMINPSCCPIRLSIFISPDKNKENTKKKRAGSEDWASQ